MASVVFLLSCFLGFPLSLTFFSSLRRTNRKRLDTVGDGEDINGLLERGADWCSQVRGNGLESLGNLGDDGGAHLVGGALLRLEVKKNDGGKE